LTIYQRTLVERKRKECTNFSHLVVEEKGKVIHKKTEDED
jgi:hypothetical protein